MAGATFSLPVTLPEGQVQLDFSRPGGQATVTVWAVPERLIGSLKGTLGVAAAAAAVLVLWRILSALAARRARKGAKAAA